jgi:hypothetical protein
MTGSYMALGLEQIATARSPRPRDGQLTETRFLQLGARPGTLAARRPGETWPYDFVFNACLSDAKKKGTYCDHRKRHATDLPQAVRP